MRALDKLIKLLEDPEEAWICMDGFYDNKRIAIKCGEFPWQCNTWPVELPLSFKERIRLWQAVQQAKVNYIERKLA